MLIKIEIQQNSELQIIEDEAFSEYSITSIISKVIRTEEYICSKIFCLFPIYISHHSIIFK